jgi:LuxR family maltose regulon positive regulatory protein
MGWDDGATEMRGNRFAAPEDLGGLALRRLALELLSAPGTKVAVITAPAGYGKTSHATAWARRDARPVAWIDLDATHNDARVFLGDLAAALRSVTDVDVGAQWDRGATADEYSTVVAARVGRAVGACSVPFVLVLDDVQELQVLPMLDLVGAVASSIPEGSELVLVGRSCSVQELRRLRALPGTVEIGVAELALGVDDATEVLDAMGVKVSDEDAAAVIEETEGWPVGVRLAGVAALEAQRRGDADGAAPWLSGRELAVAEFLDSQWLLELTDDERRFLSGVSPLAQLTAPLCDSVLGRSDSGDILHRLFRDRTLLVPLDRRRDTYRMHGLLREALGAELERRDPTGARTAHERASAYYESSGDPDGAVRHAVAAGDLDRAERLIVEHTPALFANGHFTTMEQWIELLPRPRVLSSAGLCLTAALGALGLGRPESVSVWLRLGEHAAAADPDTSPVVRLCLLDLLSTTNTGAVRPALEKAAEAYRGLPPGIWHAGACLAYGAWTWTAGEGGAVEILREGAEEAAVFGAPAVEASCTAMLSLTAQADGDLALTRELALRARGVAVEHGLEDAPGMAVVSAAHALAMACMGEAADGAASLRAARSQLAHLRGLSGWANVQSRVALAHASLLLGDPVGTDTMLREAQEFLVRQPDAVRARRQVVELEELTRHRRQSAMGSSSLSTAELRVLRFLPTHLSVADIGERLFVSRYTVKTHCSSIYRKLGVGSRSEAVDVARRHGLLD